MVITSLENQKVKDLCKLQQKKYRDLTGTYLVEGEHLVLEAHKDGCILEVICLEEESSFMEYPNILVSYEVMKKISSLDTPPKMMALCQKKEQLEIVGDKILLLDNVQDPGNLGTIIRSSLAFGVSTIVLTPNCVDVYNSKVIRSTQGMFFHLPIVVMEAENAISMMKERKIPVYGTDVSSGVDARSLSLPEKEKFCLIMGNEGVGVSSSILSLCDKNLYIPISSQVESLNVGVACSILLYELGR